MVGESLVQFCFEDILDDEYLDNEYSDINREIPTWLN